MRVPNELLEKRERLSDGGVRSARKLHVKHSVEILRDTPGLPDDLAALALLHHERHDGSGYPKGLRGQEIGMIGSIAGDRRHLRRADRPAALRRGGLALGGAQHALQVARHVLRRAPRRAVHPLHRHFPGRQRGRAQTRRGRHRHRAEPGEAPAAARDGDPRRRRAIR